MKVKELRDMLNQFVLDGKGDLDVVCFGSEYYEGNYGHECVEEIKVDKPRPLYQSEKMTNEVIVIN